MGIDARQRAKKLKTIIILWVIRILVGSSIAFIAKKADTYLDNKYGSSNYDEKIIEIWNSIKQFF